MVLPLQAAIGTLLASLIAIVARYFIGEWKQHARAVAQYRGRCAARDATRQPASVDAIIQAHWGHCDHSLKHAWTSLATTIDMRPELMRPTDGLCDIIMTGEEYGPDTVDLADWILDSRPQINPYRILDNIARTKGDAATVADLIDEVL